MNVCKLDREYYYINEPIGFGSFSIIYKGYKYEDNSPVAIKLITKIVDPKYFENEVKIMRKINHDNILKLYKVIKKNDKIYLILEYCNGGDLSNYIKNRINSYDNKFFHQILEGLKYLYNHKILHRDIKPQNILIHNNNIKISDFGFAKSFEKTELITTFCGSPLYMAPEILKDRKYTAKSDIWSLGVLLFELLSKTHPYACNSRNELWLMAKDNKFTINYSKINNYCKQQYISNLLQYNLEDRYNWEQVFEEKSTFRERLFSGENFRSSEIPINTVNNISQSVIISPNNCLKNNFHSVLEIKNNDSYFQRHDDCTIYSRSAPNSLGLSYLENYINNKKDNNEKKSLPIIENSPDIKPKSYLDMSINAFKNFFI